jgi:hypothetical protein
VKKGPNGSVSVCDEPVIWDDFRRGPAKTWADLPWVAYGHNYSRAELVALSPKIGPKVKLDAVVGDEPSKAGKDPDKLPDMFKRARVWEVWDKQERKVYWFATSYPDGPLKVADDPYRLREFFPSPKPLYAVNRTDTLTPVCRFMLWKPLADEMDSLTARIAGIVKVMKLRGLYAGKFENVISKLEGLEDGQLAAAEDAERALQEGGLDKSIWMFPVDMAIQVVEGLYKARQEAKAAIYELTGVADILRGETEASETATAQQIKAQWGSLRLQDGQRDVQRYARDLYRMKADLSCQEMEFAEMVAMTGVDFMPDMPEPPPVPPNAPPEAQMQPQMAQQAAQQQAMAQAQQMAAAVEKLLKGDPEQSEDQALATDLQREFKIEIETDSTIRADLSQAQQNISGFVTGLGEFMQSAGPAVQAGYMPPEVAIGYIGVFSRQFKLGREAEAITDQWMQAVKDLANKPKEPSPEEKKAQLEMQAMQQKAALETQKQQADLQAQQAKNAMEMEKAQAELALKREELQLKREEMALKAQAMQQEQAMKAQAAQQEHAFNMQSMQEQAAFESQQRTANAQHEDQRRSAEIDFMKQKQAMRPANGAAQ